MSEDTATVAAPEVTPVVIQDARDDNSFLVTIDRIDSDHYKNPRTVRKDTAVTDMISDLDEQGQIHPISGKMLPSGKIGVMAGFTRTEAFWRRVCKPLIKKWNDEHELSGTAKMLMVANREDRELVIKAYPEEFNTEKNKPKNKIAVKLMSAKDETEAFLISYGENAVRTEMCIFDDIGSMMHMLNELKMKGKEVANRMKVTPGQVSALKKVWRLTTDLEAVMITPEPGESFVESDLVKLKESAKILCDVLVNRMKLLPDNNVYVPISHLKQLSAVTWVRDAEETGDERIISRKQLIELVCQLVGADPKTMRVTGYNPTDESKPNLVGNNPPPNFGVFVHNCKTAEEIAKKKKSGAMVDESTAAVAEDVAAINAAATSPAADGAVSGTVEVLAAAQKVAEAGATGNAVQPKTYAETQAEAAAAAKKPDGSSEAAVANADVVVTANKAASILGVDAADIPTDDDVEVELSDVTNRKVQRAPIENVKPKDPNVVLQAIQTFADMATQDEEIDTDKNLAATALNLGAVVMGYDMLGMSKQKTNAEVKAQQYCVDLQTYISNLEEYAEVSFQQFTKAGGKGLKPFALEAPTFSKSDLNGPLDDVYADDSEEAGDEDTDADYPEDMESDVESENTDDDV